MKRVYSWPLPHVPNPNPPVVPQKAWDDMTWEEKSYAIVDRTRSEHSHGVRNKAPRKRTAKVRKPRRGLIR